MNKQKDDEFMFTWAIENFSTSFQPKEQLICSPGFAQDFIFGVKWYLKLYPKVKHDEEYISIFLTRNEDNLENFKINFCIQGTDCTGNIIFSSKYALTEYRHNSGFRMRIRKHSNFSSLQSNILIIKCCLKVRGNEERKSFLPLSHESGLFTDITLRANDTTFKVHKAILWARWPKIVEKLDAEQASEQTFDIGSNVLEAIVKYVYTGKIIYTNSDLLEELTAAAIKYELPKVQGIPVVAQEGRTRIDIHNISFEWPIEDLSILPMDTVLHHTFSVSVLQSSKWNLIIYIREKTEDGINFDISVSRVDDHEPKSIFVRSKIFSIEKYNYREELLESSKTWNCAVSFRDLWIYSKDVSLKCDFEFSDCSYFSEIVNSSFAFSSSMNVHNLSSDFQNLYKSGILSDVNIIVGSRTFPVHKSILCFRSSVFSKMFETNMTETEDNNVNISDTDPDIMDEFLLFIYSGNLGKPLNETATKLYSVADKYDVPFLKKKCSSFLESHLSAENVHEVLLLATMHCDDDLYKSVIEFSAINKQEIFSADEWKDIAKENIWVKFLHAVIVHKMR
ncbi:speckle-type POZ protein B-like [Stegodyphus dumicola]|uniref:speckle-type POZ protein B-like n=1 Tax=Stegodyphus dumicola TaxID=202533 RepID=UPI0015AAF8C8|nr:speckle-type POZ protein B-like [Stegodyphus dumicola]